jgi:hypothetical protein
MNVYTDPRLLDVQGAVESLPEFSVTSDRDPHENHQRLAAGAETFTAHASNLVAPAVLLTADSACVSKSSTVNVVAFPRKSRSAKRLDATPIAGKEKRPLSVDDNRRRKSGRQDGY